MRNPPFCPNPHCGFHHDPPIRRWWICNGTYASALSGRVQRFRCRSCGCGFSSQSFSIDYFAKTRVCYQTLAELIASCCGIRQIARLLRVSYQTVENKIMRFARQTLSMHATVIDRVRLAEHLCADGLQSYWVSQYVPNNITVLAGAESRFVYAAVGTSLSRAGRMTDSQRKRRDALRVLFRADPQATQRGFAELCDTVTRLVSCSSRAHTRLDTDNHPAYRRAIAGHGPWCLLHGEGRLSHHRTSSLAPRSANNPLAPVNTIDRQIRIDLAEHVRETVRHARNPNRSMERFAVWRFQYNYHKRFRINQPVADKTTHAQAAGISPAFLCETTDSIYSRRRFRSRSSVTGPDLLLWLRMLERPFKKKPDYLPSFLL